MQGHYLVRWEYHMERLPVWESGEVESRLNEYGKDLWELVQVVTHSPTEYLLLLKRPVSQV